VLLGVDLEIRVGERVAIVGASGSGKSTLLHLLGGLDAANGGEVQLMGHDLNRIERRAARQPAQSPPRFRLSVSSPARRIHRAGERRHAAVHPAHAESRGRSAGGGVLGEVGLGHRLRHTPSELSGGERQRAAIARALVTEPACVLADEPTGNLDRQTAAGVFELMLALNRSRQTSFVIVTHDPALAGRAERILTLRDGSLHSSRLILPRVSRFRHHLPTDWNACLTGVCS
jgi:lipoprotein-releasing system ATP-binding protein